MLRLVWLGALKKCADLAEAAAFDPGAEEYTRATAGRAVIAAGDDALKRRYSAFVKDNCGALPHMVVMEAIDGLFPAVIDVGNLLEILTQIDVAGRDGGSTVEWQAPVWVDRLETRTELEQLLRGFLTQLGPEPVDIGHIPDSREEAYLSGIAAAGAWLLQHCRSDEAPNDAIDAALRLGLAERYGHRSLRERRDVAAELQRTPARRRLAFWRAAEQRNEHRWLQGGRSSISAKLPSLATRRDFGRKTWIGCWPTRRAARPIISVNWRSRPRWASGGMRVHLPKVSPASRAPGALIQRWPRSSNIGSAHPSRLRSR